MKKICKGMTIDQRSIVWEISDMADGFIARKTHTESKIGEVFDSIADLIFVLICLFKILPTLHISAWLWMWILLIAIIKIANLVVG